jgi:hypothetical protein
VTPKNSGVMDIGIGFPFQVLMKLADNAANRAKKLCLNRVAPNGK